MSGKEKRRHVMGKSKFMVHESILLEKKEGSVSSFEKKERKKKTSYEFYLFCIWFSPYELKKKKIQH